MGEPARPSALRLIPRLRYRAAAFLAALVAVTAAVPLPRLRDAATLSAVDGAHLALPWSYLVLAPFCVTLDMLTLFSVRQHIAFVASAAGAYVAWRAVSRARSRPSRVRTLVVREAILGVAALTLLVAVYVVGALMPRPMARLATVDPDAVVVDFHAHTSASHDGRPGHTPEAVRRWHRAAGFDAVYITDHATFAGAREGMARNPPHGGTETLILSGIEHIWRGQHVNVLGDTADFLGAVERRRPGNGAPSPEPTPAIVLTIPGDLSRIPRPDREYVAGVTAIELSDGSPRGLAQIRRQRRIIVALADSLGLTLVAGSDNHGWGYTAAAWTVMTLPGARGVPAASLDARIREAMRQRGRAAARVVERHGPDAGESRLGMALTVPAAGWQLLRELSPGERISWCAWAGVLVVAAALVDRRKA